MSDTELTSINTISECLNSLMSFLKSYILIKRTNKTLVQCTFCCLYTVWYSNRRRRRRRRRGRGRRGEGERWEERWGKDGKKGKRKKRRKGKEKHEKKK